MSGGKRNSSGAGGAGTRDSDGLVILQASGQPASLHPSSLCSRSLSVLMDGTREAFLCYHKRVATSKVFIHDCSVVHPVGVVLFGSDLVISKSRRRLTVGGWINIRIEELHAVLLKRLQAELEALLTSKVEAPNLDTSSRQNLFIRVLLALLD
jgi:hypothetical protein